MTVTGLAAGAVLVLGALSLGGCANVGYYWQSTRGHLQMMNAARPVHELLDDATTPERLKARLVLSQRIRSFATNVLSLPENPSYRRYADVQRKAVVWNVVAAPALSLTLKTWCFPVTGCVGYRGYFAEADAQREATALRAQGLEASVYGVPAYSTLGWLNWAGGDPLLNTFIDYPEGELARLVFHELAHQVVYASGDTLFNESFATAVERLGGERWLTEQAPPATRQAYDVFNTRRQQFRALSAATRQALAAIYALKPTPAQTLESLLAIQLVAKEATLQRFRQDYAMLTIRWSGFAGYDGWVARANNASFGAQAAYDDLVPGFMALFEDEGRDWPRFYAAVKALAALPQAERHAALKIPDASPSVPAPLSSTPSTSSPDTPH
jgi:predicted aminopeptidase